MRRQAELALAIVGIVLLAGIGWALLIRPQSNKAALAADRETLALGNADRLRTDIAERRELQKQANALQGRVGALDKLFPQRPQLAELTDALQAIADQTSVQLTSVQPSVPVRGAETDPLARVPVQLTLVGGYFQLADFLNRLETLTPTNAAETGSSSRAVLVQSVSLTPAGGGGSSGSSTDGGTTSSGDLTAAVTMIAFQSTKEPATATTTGQSSTGTTGSTGSTAPTTTTTAPTQTTSAPG
jgi:Tfp pilus assembly protein PilO